MGLGQDARYAARQLRRSPMFTTVAVASLAIGMAGAAAIFSLADALIFRERAGIGRPERLVEVGRSQDGAGFDNMSYPNYADLRDRNTVFSGLAAFPLSPEPIGLGDDTGAERVFGTIVSANFFDVLQTPMALGRGFRAEEDRDGAPLVTVLSHTLWSTRFNARPDVLGTVVRLNGRSFTVVGVAAPRFVGTNVLASDLWIPMGAIATISGNAEQLKLRPGVWLQAVGRLRDGVTFEQAAAEMTRLGRDLEREFPRDNAGKGIVVASSSRVPQPGRLAVGGFLGLLTAMITLVLLIACSNVAGMLLARAADRSRDVAVRLALGASARRIVRQLLFESSLLSGISTLVGVLVSMALVRALTNLPTLEMVGVPFALELRLDWRVVSFSAAVAIATGVLFGLAPALHAARTALTALRSDASTYTPMRLRGRRVFLVTQISMSVLLVVVAALFVRSLQVAARVDPGFNVEGIEIVGMDFRLGGYSRETGPALAARLLERARQVPGIASVAYARMLPLTQGGLGLGRLTVPGRAADDPVLARTDWNVVSGDYFETMGTPLVQGRTFVDGDGASAPRVAIVNETFAARVWPGLDAIGQTLYQEGPPDRGEPPTPLRVVGIARNAKYRSLDDIDRPFIYVPYTQQYMADLTLVARRRTSTSVLPALRAAVADVDPALPVVRATTLAIVTAAGLLPNRVAAWVAGVVGTVGIALAGIGVYGLMAFSVVQRRREMGVRLALGADRRTLLWFVVRQAVALVGLGSAVGLAAAALSSQLLEALLFGLSPLDPTSFLLGGSAFVLLALGASLIPALRAASINPVDALRSQ